MPIVTASPFRPPWNQPGGHLQTIIPAKFRKVETITRDRERIETPDGDFLILDWCRRQSGSADSNSPRRLAILSHGLEGHSKRPYIQGVAHALHHSPQQWDILAWNCRGCGGEMNRLPQFYHSGSTEDLEAVVDHALSSSSPSFDEIALVGFSLGGNLTLKYLGDSAGKIDPRIRAAAAFSVACDLASASVQLEKWQNRLYMRDFLRSLEDKIRQKSSSIPDLPDPDKVRRMHTFREFDDLVTAPLHGFINAEDYWEKASCKPVLTQIRIPTLLAIAKNDPFLSDTCFPVAEAEQSAHLFFESTRHGGHVGFATSTEQYWSELRTVAFFEEVMS